MNRAEIRQAMFTLRSRGVPDTDTKAIATYNTLIDLAYKRLCSECPSALLPDMEHCILLPEYRTVGTATGTTISKTADPFVMEFHVAGTWLPTMDGTWDGIYHLEITDSRNTVHRRQCREFWVTQEEGVFPPVYHYYVSLDRPWDTNITGNMNFRLYSPEFFTQDDVVQVLDGGLWDSARGFMVPVAQGAVHFQGWNDVRGDVRGRPANFYRSRHFQLDAPNFTPTVTPAVDQEQLVWGLEATGKFDYCFTYVWGKRDQMRQDPAGNYDPQWESSPSPVSAAIVVPTNRHTTVTVGLPDVDWQVFYDKAGTLRQTHSGLRKRIYRRRYTSTGAAPLITAIEAPEVFQFLAEVDGATTTFTDNGSVVPGYYRRLPEVHGYYAWTGTPQQDQRYELDLRVLRRPRSLLNDYDAPRVHPDAIDALIQWCVYYFDQNDNNLEGAAAALRAAKEMTGQLRSRYANPSAFVEAVPWDGMNIRMREHPWIGRARA